MKRGGWLATASLPFALLLAAACGGSAQNGGDLELRESLRRMVLQDEDLSGLQRLDESFTTNEDVAAGGIGGATPLERLQEWGRILGLEATFEPPDPAATGSPVRGVNSAVSLYKTADGAAASFADAVRDSETRDWKVNYTGLEELERRKVERQGVADEVLWQRFTGIQVGPSGAKALVIDDLIIFRVDRVRAFLRVLSSAEEETNRELLQGQVESWLRSHVRRVTNGLAAGVPE